MPRSQSDNHGINVGHVDYIDYATAELPPYNIYYPYLHKRHAFRHEREMACRPCMVIFEYGDRLVTIFENVPLNFESGSPFPYAASETRAAS